MDREHFFYRQEHDLGHVNAISYRINALMTLEERDLLQEALKLYKQKLDEEVSFCKFVNLEKTRVLSLLEMLSKKFDTMDWRE